MKLQKKNIPFTMVANDVLNRKDLSWKAKGIYAYLFSKPDGWDFSASRIAESSVDGRHAVMSALQELEDAGCLERKKLSTGRIDYILQYAIEQTAGAPAEMMTGEVKESDKPGVIIAPNSQDTPRQYATRFFDPQNSESRAMLLKVIVEKNSGADAESIRGEIVKFCRYWTELNGAGTKQRWQLQKTFDVRLRFATWIGRSGMGNKKPAQTGTTI